MPTIKNDLTPTIHHVFSPSESTPYSTQNNQFNLIDGFELKYASGDKNSQELLSVAKNSVELNAVEIDAIEYEKKFYELSKEEQNAVRMWTMVDAEHYERYSDGNKEVEDSVNYELNKDLAHGLATYQQHDDARILSSALNKLPKFNGESLRIVEHSEERPDPWATKIQVGDIVTSYPCFMSSSETKDYSAKTEEMGYFSQEGTTILVNYRIKNSNQAVPLLKGPASLADEHEVVSPRNACYKVTGISIAEASQENEMGINKIVGVELVEVDRHCQAHNLFTGSVVNVPSTEEMLLDFSTINLEQLQDLTGRDDKILSDENTSIDENESLSLQPDSQSAIKRQRIDSSSDSEKELDSNTSYRPVPKKLHTAYDIESKESAESEVSMQYQVNSETHFRESASQNPEQVYEPTQMSTPLQNESLNPSLKEKYVDLTRQGATSASTATDSKEKRIPASMAKRKNMQNMKGTSHKSNKLDTSKSDEARNFSSEKPQQKPNIGERREIELEKYKKDITAIKEAKQKEDSKIDMINMASDASILPRPKLTEKSKGTQGLRTSKG